MQAAAPLSDGAKKVLRILSERPTIDGYSVMSLTKLDVPQLIEAIQQLQKLDLVDVKGGLDEKCVADSYLWLRRMAVNEMKSLL